jgi:hypothetical protein
MTETQRLAPSIGLNHRVIEAATAYTISRMKILECIPGNPVGVAYRKVGEATALSAQNLPSTFFNTVVGLRAEQASEIESLVEWYRERGQGARFEIAAGDHDPSLGRELARLGFFPVWLSRGVDPRSRAASFGAARNLRGTGHDGSRHGGLPHRLRRRTWRP